MRRQARRPLGGFPARAPEVAGEDVRTTPVARSDAPGGLPAAEVVVVADGGHWIRHLVAERFPEATQIVDWYHASQYLWRVAHAVDGAGAPLARRWAPRRLDDRWAGRVARVLTALAAHRMRYAEYRARGPQVGSGPIESGCKQVSAARLKQSGMVWSRDGARAVAAVRTWAESGQWQEAVTLRPPRQRTYQRQAAEP